MNRTYRVLPILGILFTFSLYGFFVGYYKIFPFHLIEDIRTSSAVQNVVDHTMEMVYSRDTPSDRIVDTFLHRLNMKEIPLQDGIDSRARYLSAISNGELLLILDTHGDFMVFDPVIQEQVTHEIQPVPMNLEMLKKAPVADFSGFNLNNFRTLGVHTESQNKRYFSIFVSHHTYLQDQNCISFAISRGTVSLDNHQLVQQGNWNRIYSSEPCLSAENEDFWLSQRAGGSFTDWNEDSLLVTVGDHAFDGHRIPDATFAQDTTNPYGKVLRIHKDSGDHTIIASGLRNSQGIFKDGNGNVWATDHGPEGGDELNIIRNGQNYGWPVETYGRDYNSEPWPFATVQGSHSKYTPPQYAWLYAIAPTKIIRLEDNSFPLWSGDLLISTLSARSLYRLRTGENNHIVYDERIELGYRVRDMVLLADGSIALMTDQMVLLIIQDAGEIFNKDLISTK